MIDPDLHRTIALASKAKTRVKQLGKRGLTDASEDEVLAMAKVCDLLLAEYPCPITKVEPDLSLFPTSELETLE